MSVSAPSRFGADALSPGRRRRSPWPRRARRLVGLGVLLGVLGVAAVAVRVWQVGRQDHRPHSDAIVVLGAAQYDGVPSATLAARLDHAALLYREGVAAHVVTVGGKRPGDLYTEAASGVAYLERHGVPAAALTAVPTGDDTLHSLEAAQTVFARHGWQTTVLVTDPWHSLRSRLMASDLGLTATTSPTHSGPASHGRATEVRYIARETAGIIDYELFHRP